MFVGPEHVLAIGPANRKLVKAARLSAAAGVAGYERAAWLLTYGRSDALAMWIT